MLSSFANIEERNPIKGLQDDEKEMVIKLMLLAEGEENSARILVCSAVF